MSGAIALCNCEGPTKSLVQTHCLDRHRVFCCSRRRYIMLHRRTSYRHICNSAEPDWDSEMSLFRKRSLKPNQMETVRRLEEEVDIGKVRGPNSRSVEAVELHEQVCEDLCYAARCCFRRMA